MAIAPAREVSKIESIYCVCKKTTSGVRMMDGWDCSCDVRFEDGGEEKFFFNHVAIIKKPEEAEIAKAESEITRLEEAYHGPEERRYRQLKG